jgi:hypothetical protein
MLNKVQQKMWVPGFWAIALRCLDLNLSHFFHKKLLKVSKHENWPYVLSTAQSTANEAVGHRIKLTLQCWISRENWKVWSWLRFSLYPCNTWANCEFYSQEIQYHIHSFTVCSSVLRSVNISSWSGSPQTRYPEVWIRIRIQEAY